MSTTVDRSYGIPVKCAERSPSRWGDARGTGVNLNDPARALVELRRAIESGRAESIAQAAMSNIWPLYSMHYDMLSDAIVSLPSPVLERHAALRVLHPMTPVLAQTTRPFTPVVGIDDSRSMLPEALDILTLIRIVACRLAGDVNAALGHARRLEERMRSVRVEARDRMDGPLWFFHHQIGTTLLAVGDTGRALLEFATSRQLGRFSIQPDAERLALGRAALAHAVRGALAEADRALADAAELPPPSAGFAVSGLTTERTAAALIAVDRMSDDMDDRLAVLDSFEGVQVTWPFALLARTRALLARQQPEDALEAIQLAAGSHRAAQGSFAADVIAAISIKALLMIGDVARARGIVEECSDAGMLTRLANVRVSLHEGRFEAASQELQFLARDRRLGPAQRSESTLLSGWLELGRTDSLGNDTALQISRIARRQDNKRLFALMPRQLVDQVRQRLSEDAAVDFSQATAGLASFEMDARPALTRGELRVLNALPVHGSIAAMASSFHVSPNTIKSQLRSLYRKLGCSTRADAISAARRLNFLELVPRLSTAAHG